jgi:hypothetical protein
MSIILQSSVGFSAEFMREVPMLEKAMIAHGLEPSKFVISKDSASPSTRHVVGTFFYDYTVFIDGEHFTLTEPNDMVFLDYFLKLCTAEENVRPLLKLRRGRVGRGSPHRGGLGRGSLGRGSLGLIRRFLRWMAQPV